MQENRCKKKNYIICFLISFALRAVWFLAQKKMICIQDELGFLVVPSTLGGNDWTGAIDNISYYGFGYSALITPVYLLTNNPFVIYWSMMVLGAVVLALTSCVIYNLTTVHMGIDPGTAVYVSIAMPFLAVTEMRYLNNEPMITFVVWAMVLLLVMLHGEENRIRKNVLSVLLMLLTMYTLTIHNRLVAVVACLFLVLIVFWIRDKKPLVTVPSLVGMLVFSAVIIKMAVPFIEKKFWHTDLRGAVANTVSATSDSMTGAASNLLDPGFADAVFRIFAGNMFTSAFFSCGLVAIAAVVMLYELFGLIKRRGADIPGKNTGDILLVDLFGWTTFLLTVLGLSLLWAGGVHTGLQRGKGVYEYGYKIFYYIRYYSAYLSVIIYVLLVRVYNTERLLTWAGKLKSLIFVLFFSDFFLKLISPYLAGTSNGITAFGAYLNYHADRETTDLILYITIFVILAVLFAVIIKLTDIGRSKAVVLLVIMMFVIDYHRGFYNSAILNGSYENRGDAGYTLFRQLEKDESIDKEIYVTSGSRHGFTSYQMHLCDYRIIPSSKFPMNIEKGFVVTDRVKDQMTRIENGFTLYKLDDNEYLWVKGYDFADKLGEVYDLEEG